MAPIGKSPNRHHKTTVEWETNPEVLARRQKQIDYGKATSGYHNYLNSIPKHKRTSKQPRTPDKRQVCSRRSWDGQVKLWRLLLHAHDDDKNGSSADTSINSEMSEQSADGMENSIESNDSFSN